MLLLADSRFPAGAHAHSGGIEEAIERALVVDAVSLAAFLGGRLATGGVLSAAAAAAVCERCGGDVGQARAPALGRLWADVDAELDARYPSPAWRAASRTQGAQFLRGSLAVLGGPVLRSLREHAAGAPHHSVALGAAAGAAGLHAREAAVVAAYQSVTGPASAAVRLLGLDPFQVALVIAGLAQEIDRIADTAGERAGRPLDELPAQAGPVSDLLAESHVRRKERLFAS
jgi:urease accessory protein